MLVDSFLDQVDARKGRWRDTAAEARGIHTAYYWTGPGRDELEVAYGTTETKPNTTVVRELWKHRHGRAAAPPLVVPAYPRARPQRTMGPGLATVDEFVDEGEHKDAHDPSIRRTMAQTLAWLIDLAREVPDVRGLDKGWRWPKKGKLWPEPHNVLFDFETTAEGAGWIDEVAAETKRVLDGFHGEVVVGHTGWSVDQMRFEGGEAVSC